MSSVSTAGPLICSQFDPSNSYLATATVALDTHQIRVQSVNASQTSLNTSFNLDSGVKVTCVNWISSSSSAQQMLIALSLNNGTTHIYSPFTNQIIADLVTPTNLAITDFHYSVVTASAWCSDINGNVFEWDLSTFSLVQHFTINDLLESNESINKISSINYLDKPHLLIGSHSVYLFDLSTHQIVKTFPAHVQPINAIHLAPSHPDLFLTSATNDRFINLYSLSKNTTKAVFVAQSAIHQFVLGSHNDKTILSVINESGNLEFFHNPLSLQDPATASASSTPSKKKRRHQLSSVSSRSSNAYIKLSRPSLEIKSPNDANLFINTITNNHESIIYTWLENANVSHFDNLKWLDESGEFALNGEITLHKSRPTLKPAASHAERGHDVAANKHYKEGSAIISEGNQFKDVDNVSEDEEQQDEDEDDGETLAEKLEKLSTDQKNKNNNQNNQNKNNNNQNNTQNNQNKQKKIKLNKRTTTATLTIVLAQSLKNNDHTLLETVLVNRDPQIVQNTIARLDPSLAVILLDRLSEKITRQASRFDQLNFWLKWIIIIHGGVLSSLPNLNTKLANLHAILNKKANTLPRLLELQGRLNMVYQQIDLKKEILHGDQFAADSDDDAEEGVEYIEELDDAKFNGELSDDEDDDTGSDIDMSEGLHDDYMASDDEHDEMANGDSKAALDSDAEEDEGYSDVEINDNTAVKDDVMIDDEELEDAEAELRLQKKIAKLKSKK